MADEKKKAIFTADAPAPAPSRVGNQYEYLIEAERQGAAAQAATIKGIGSFTLDAVKGYAEAQVEKAATHAARNLVNTDANYIGEDVKQRVQGVGVFQGAITDLEKARDTYGESPETINPQVEKFKKKIDAITGSANTGALTPQEARLYVANEIRKWGAILPGYLDDFRKVAAKVTGVDNLDGVDIRTAFTLAKEDQAKKQAAELYTWQLKKVYEDLEKNPDYANNPAATMAKAKEIVGSSPEVQQAALNLKRLQASTAATEAKHTSTVAEGKATLDTLTGLYNTYRTTDPNGKLGIAPATTRLYTDIAVATKKFGLYRADGSVNVIALQSNGEQIMAEMARIKNDFLSNVQQAHDNGIARMRLSAANVNPGELEKQIAVLETNHRQWREANEAKLNDTDHWLDTLKAISAVGKERAETRNQYLQVAQALTSLSNSDFITKVTGETTSEGYRKQYPWAADVFDAVNANVRAGTGVQFIVGVHKAAEGIPDTSTPEGQAGVKVKMGNGELSLERGIAGKENKTLSGQQKADVLYYASYADYVRSPAQLDKLLQGGDEKKLAAHLGDPALAKQIVTKVSERLRDSLTRPTTESQAIREGLPTTQNAGFGAKAMSAVERAVQSLISLSPRADVYKAGASRNMDVPYVKAMPNGSYEFAVRMTGTDRGKPFDELRTFKPSPDQYEQARIQLDNLKARVELYNKLNANGTQLDFQTVLNNMATPPGQRVQSDAIPAAQRASTQAKIANAEALASRIEKDITAFAKYPNDPEAKKRVEEKTAELAELRAGINKLSQSLNEEGAE